MRRLAASITVVAALLLAGCGSDSESSQPTIVGGSPETTERGVETSLPPDTTMRPGTTEAPSKAEPTTNEQEFRPAVCHAAPELEAVYSRSETYGGPNLGDAHALPVRTLSFVTHAGPLRRSKSRQSMEGQFLDPCNEHRPEAEAVAHMKTPPMR